MKNKETIILMGVALVIGILVGVIGSNIGGRGRQRSVGNAPPPASAPVVNQGQNIKMLEAVVAKDPANRNAWVQLGNTYFDTQQPMKAIEAYGKALEIDGNDPNVLTDQGIMFRQLGWYDRAIDNFEKATAIDPNHSQSYYNLGVVYRYDLKDFPKAIEAWQKFLDLNPTGQGADQVRRDMEVLKSHPPIPQPNAEGAK
ncbi:hypothetical protein C2E25_05915 [Geothermobacter hydrogeniphilus]|uniref:Uncharacterized protein n=1 Tax=Geothermobacter hydrogeniphilus TaxID=1969733 RepID=A0A2K2HBY3_9BACT|nr:tetratricopeptide repeat protein [Geothermobacter hydrogeniphilus]PNU20751.1 hypothetical protein C2E25_05915 [Geothermobacter hydrogeniphilus]